MTIEEISIFSNSSHFEWKVGLSDTIMKGDDPGTITARFGLIWFRGFRGEDLNVKVYDVRRTDGRWTPSDGKGSHGLCPGELNKGLEVQNLLAGKLNPFWKDVFCNFSELKSMDTDICDKNGGRCGRDRMVVGFTTTYAISAYHH